MTTPTPSGRFEERLLQQLTHVVSDNPNPHLAPAAAVARPRARRARLALAGTVLAGAAAATVVLATSSGGTSDAFAVTPQSNGTVSVTVNDLSDASGLEHKLRDVGIPAVVTYSTDPGACSDDDIPSPPASGTVTRHVGSADDAGPTLVTGGKPAPAGTVPPPSSSVVGGPPKGAISVLIRKNDGDVMSATFTLNPDDYTSGHKLLISAAGGAISSLGVRVATGPGTPAPPCLPAP